MSSVCGYWSYAAEDEELYFEVTNSIAGWAQIGAYMAFCEVSQDQSAGTVAARGDFGFKVLTSSDPAEKTKKLSAELANGRLAMMAIIGMRGAQIQMKRCSELLSCDSVSVLSRELA